jgi:uncharacterized membrane protein
MDKKPMSQNNHEHPRSSPVFSNRAIRIFLIVLAAWIVGGFWMVLGDPSRETGLEKPFRWHSFLAPFHSVILHYPIGFITIVCALEIVGFFRKKWEFRQSIGIIMLLSAMSAVLAAGLGWLRAQGGDYNVVILERHRWSGLIVTVLTILTTLIYFKTYRGIILRRWVVVYRTGLFFCLLSLMVAGHEGGNLTHGTRYLTKNAPAFFRNLMGDDVEANSIEGESFYAQRIAPIFEAKCVQCHGSEKQNGKYRLDEAILAAQTSSGKTVIKPGAPLQSELIRRVTLPRSHEEVMPPDGKLLLTSDEIMTLVEWIYKGALIDK